MLLSLVTLTCLIFTYVITNMGSFLDIFFYTFSIILRRKLIAVRYYFPLLWILLDIFFISRTCMVKLSIKMLISWYAMYFVFFLFFLKNKNSFRCRKSPCWRRKGDLSFSLSHTRIKSYYLQSQPKCVGPTKWVSYTFFFFFG